MVACLHLQGCDQHRQAGTSAELKQTGLGKGDFFLTQGQHAVLHANMLNTETLDPTYNKKLKLQAFSGRTVFLGMVVPGPRYLGLCAVCNILSFLVSPDKGCKRVYKPSNLAQLDSFHLMITAQGRRERKQK